jgi:hypothetical protein
VRPKTGGCWIAAFAGMAIEGQRSGLLLAVEFVRFYFLIRTLPLRFPGFPQMLRRAVDKTVRFRNLFLRGALRGFFHTPEINQLAHSAFQCISANLSANNSDLRQKRARQLYMKLDTERFVTASKNQARSLIQ